MSALSDLLNRHFDERFKDWSNRKIAELSGVSRGTIDNYRNGTHPATPSEEVLEAFHELLRIPMPELREAAGLRTGELDPYVPPSEANRMSSRQRQAVDELIRSIVETQGGATHADTPAQSDRQASPPRTPRSDDENQKTNKPTDLSTRRSRRGTGYYEPVDGLAAADDRGPDDEDENARARRLQDEQGEEGQGGNE